MWNMNKKIDIAKDKPTLSVAIWTDLVDDSWYDVMTPEEALSRGFEDSIIFEKVEFVFKKQEIWFMRKIILKLKDLFNY